MKDKVLRRALIEGGCVRQSVLFDWDLTPTNLNERLERVEDVQHLILAHLGLEVRGVYTRYELVPKGEVETAGLTITGSEIKLVNGESFGTITARP